jgi:hypothetical protein
MNKLDKATNHCYYSYENNFYTNDYPTRYDTVSEFLDNMNGACVSMNYCFRFDIREYESDIEEEEYNEDKQGLYVEIFIIHQRKGIYHPFICESYDPKTEGEALRSYLQIHYEHGRNDLWKEFSCEETPNRKALENN